MSRVLRAQRLERRGTNTTAVTMVLMGVSIAGLALGVALIGSVQDALTEGAPQGSPREAGPTSEDRAGTTERVYASTARAPPAAPFTPAP